MSSPMSPEVPATLPEQLKCLAHPKRLRIFDLLMQGVQCNCELADALSLAPNLISHHIDVLRRADLITVEHDAQDARWSYYSIDPIALAGLRHVLCEFLDPARIQPRQPNCGPQRRQANSEDESSRLTTADTRDSVAILGGRQDERR